MGFWDFLSEIANDAKETTERTKLQALQFGYKYAWEQLGKIQGNSVQEAACAAGYALPFCNLMCFRTWGGFDVCIRRSHTFFAGRGETRP